MGSAAMTVLLDTSTLPARDRADAFVTRLQRPSSCGDQLRQRQGPAAAVGTGQRISGSLTIFSVRSNHFSAERTRDWRVTI